MPQDPIPQHPHTKPPHFLMWGIMIGLVVLVCVGWWWNIRSTLLEGGSGLQELWQEVQGTKQDISEQTQSSRTQLSETFDAIKDMIGEAVSEEAKDQITSQVVEDMKETLEAPKKEVSDPLIQE